MIAAIAVVFSMFAGYAIGVKIALIGFDRRVEKARIESLRIASRRILSHNNFRRMCLDRANDELAVYDATGKLKWPDQSREDICLHIFSLRQEISVVESAASTVDDFIKEGGVE